MENLSRILNGDSDGMSTYEYIVNNEETCIQHMDELVENLKKVDSTGQFLASSARFLNAIDKDRYEKWIPVLIEGAIEKDKERKYIGHLLEAIWGADFKERANEIEMVDDNFRRIFKRLYPEEALGSSRHRI